MRTRNQLAGDAAEDLVARLLQERGWTILGRKIRAGRSELDILAVDPGPPGRLVVVEVRWRRSRDFGLAEETFDRGKRARTVAGVARLLESNRLSEGGRLPSLPLAIDLAVVEPSANGGRSVRLYRNALAL